MKKLNYLIFLIIFGISFPTLSQKIVQNDYSLPTGKREALQLSDLVESANDLTFRFWIGLDLVIEIDDHIELTLYTNNHNENLKSNEWDNVEKYQIQNVNSEDIQRYLASIRLSEWRYDERGATGFVSDGNRFTIEYSTADNYRIFYLHEPMLTNLSLAEGTLELLNYLDAQLNIDTIRLNYYQGLIESCDNKKVKREAKHRIKRIEQYQKDYEEIWKSMNFPTMFW